MRIGQLFALTALLASGCAPYLVNRYAASTDNVEALRSLSGQAVSVGPFTATKEGQHSVSCRGAPIEASDQETFSEYVRKALVDELRLAQAYSTSSAVTLTGNLDAIDVSTNRGIWTLGMTVHSSNGRKLSVEESYSYRTAFSGDRACTLAAQNLTSAVQNLIGHLVRSPDFPSLISAAEGAASERAGSMERTRVAQPGLR